MACCEGCKGGKDATLGDLLRDAANDLASASIRMDAVSDKLAGTDQVFYAGNVDAYIEQVDDLTKRLRAVADLVTA
jgi:hypothetical protein